MRVFGLSVKSVTKAAPMSVVASLEDHLVNVDQVATFTVLVLDEPRALNV